LHPPQEVQENSSGDNNNMVIMISVTTTTIYHRFLLRKQSNVKETAANSQGILFFPNSNYENQRGLSLEMPLCEGTKSAVVCCWQ
jgi:hypothetical protein